MRITNKGPQSLIRNIWGQIQNFSDFRTAISCMYRQQAVEQHRVIKHITISAAKRHNIHTKRDKDTTDTWSCKPCVVWFKTSGLQSFSDFGVADKGLWTCSDTWKSSNYFEDCCVFSVQRISRSEDYGQRIQGSIPGKNKVLFSLSQRPHRPVSTSPLPVGYRWSCVHWDEAAWCEVDHPYLFGAYDMNPSPGPLPCYIN